MSSHKEQKQVENTIKVTNSCDCGCVCTCGCGCQNLDKNIEIE